MAGLYLNTNITSLYTRKFANRNSRELDVAYQRLASGLKINSAKDDAAGLQITDHMTTQINGLSQGNRTAQDGLSYAQTAEGALDEITTMLQRIRTLALQSANGTNSTQDRRNMQDEVDQLNEEITRIANQTTFAGQDLLNGNASVAQFQVGPTPNSLIEIDLRPGFDTKNIAKIAASNASKAGVFTIKEDNAFGLTQTEFSYTAVFNYSINGGGIDISTQINAEIVLAGIDGLIDAVDSKRAELGAVQNRLESTIRNQDNIKENVSSSRSRIRDTDFAEETSTLTHKQILEQATATILTQANSRPEIALSLLQR